MQQGSDGIGSGLGVWWGYAQADSTIVGVVVAAVSLIAAVYLIRRVRERKIRRG